VLREIDFTKVTWTGSCPAGSKQNGSRKWENYPQKCRLAAVLAREASRQLERLQMSKKLRSDGWNKDLGNYD